MEEIYFIKYSTSRLGSYKELVYLARPGFCISRRGQFKILTWGFLPPSSCCASVAMFRKAIPCLTIPALPSANLKNPDIFVLKLCDSRKPLQPFVLSSKKLKWTAHAHSIREKQPRFAIAASGRKKHVQGGEGKLLQLILIKFPSFNSYLIKVDALTDSWCL